MKSIKYLFVSLLLVGCFELSALYVLNNTPGDMTVGIVNQDTMLLEETTIPSESFGIIFTAKYEDPTEIRVNGFPHKIKNKQTNAIVVRGDPKSFIIDELMTSRECPKYPRHRAGAGHPYAGKSGAGHTYAGK